MGVHFVSFWAILITPLLCAKGPSVVDGNIPVFDPPAGPWDFTDSGVRLRLEGYKTNCSIDKCWCIKDTAVCSHSNLTFIPKLPPYVRFLDFTHNHLHAIQDENFFENVTHLRGVNLADNNMTRIHPEAFKRFTNLQSLIISFNDGLKFEQVQVVFEISTLIYLDIRRCGLGPLHDDLFQENPMPKLQVLNLHQNNLKHMNSTMYSFLPELQRLGLAQNDITWIHAHSLPKLRKLNLNNNALSNFPRTCNFSTSLFPNLTYLNLQRNKIQKFPKHVCLPSVQYLELSTNQFPEFETDMFNETRFPALTHLTLESNINTRHIQKYAFRNSNLQVLSLMYNNIYFLPAYVDHLAFQGCPNLTNLQISHNSLTHEGIRRLLGNLTTLQKLHIGFNNIEEIHKDTFVGLRGLTNISLYGNKLTNLPDGAFDKLENLEILDLSNNLISTVQERAFSPKTRKRLKRLDLSDNRFECSCDLLWFRRWLTINPALFGLSSSDQTRWNRTALDVDSSNKTRWKLSRFQRVWFDETTSSDAELNDAASSKAWGTYACYNMNNVSVASFQIVEQTCLLSSQTSLFIAVTLGLVIFGLTAGFTLYRYRWRLRLEVFEAFKGNGYRWRRLQQEHFEYDVYVSYAANDLWWVRHYLLPELEDRQGLKLCIQERDFILGEPIVDNINQSVKGSKKIMMLFSRHFTRSQWCQFELYFCLDHVMKNDDALLVVCLHDLGSREVSSAMMAVLNTAPYIQWGEDSDARLSFWGRIRIALSEVLASRRS